MSLSMTSSSMVSGRIRRTPRKRSYNPQQISTRQSSVHLKTEEYVLPQFINSLQTLKECVIVSYSWGGRGGNLANVSPILLLPLFINIYFWMTDSKKDNLTRTTCLQLFVSKHKKFPLLLYIAKFLIFKVCYINNIEIETQFYSLKA